MAAAIAPILWGAVGLGVGMLAAKALAPDVPDYSSMMSQMQTAGAQGSAASTMPELPTNPNDPNNVVVAQQSDPIVDQITGTEVADTGNAEADAAAKEQQLQAAQIEQDYNPSGGLGIQSNALGKRKTLAGV